MALPLDGIRVIDMTSVVMGPTATRILGDYGADVIKIEAPSGDAMRRPGPARHDDMGPLFLAMNRNKRSVVLDVKKDAARAAVLRMCKTADVLIHNIRPSSMARLGLGYAAVVAARPDIVYVSLTGYGERGPYAGKPAYDDLIQGASGIASILGQVTGGAPHYVPTLICDRIVGMAATHAVLAALFHRARTGEGQEIEVPMFETMAEFVLTDHLGGRAFAPAEGPPGYPRLLAANRRPYRTADGYIAALLYAEKHWQAFFAAAGRAEQFRGDARLSDAATRMANYDAAYGIVAEIMATRTTEAWLALLDENDIPAMRLNDLDALIDDPHLAAIGFFREVDHPSEGKLRMMDTPAQFSRTPPEMRRAPPRLGEHGEEVLREFGFGADEIASLRADGALAS
jgi:crotonobetainyl-CoA:carnitine CoA-transferase CaiB-like acyl-CoA transferase